MEVFILFTSLFYSFLLFTSASPLHHHQRHRHRHQGEKHEVYDQTSRPTKLFVFGDSYADTGNTRKSLGNSWKEPYGSTFPGKPAGRFSDGRVLTDYVAKFLGLKSPLAYTWMKLGGKKLRNGMNFAFGGSGVFNTLGELLPNMTTQINFCQKLIDSSFYTKSDFESSVVLVALAGNDYAAYVAKGGTIEGLQTFIPLVINQLALNLKRVHEMGARKVMVTSLEPLGCLPRMTELSSFQQCNTTQNLAVSYHNLLLQQAVDRLNAEAKTTTTFLILDLYTSFTTVLDQKGYDNLMFETPLKPCCMGINSGYFCGSVDDKGVKMYTICNDPTKAFFWDSSHPTEAGWNAVYRTTLNSSLQQFFKFY